MHPDQIPYQPRLSADEMLDAIRALRRLTQRQRHALMLHLQGYLDVEIAQSLGVSHQRVQQILDRAEPLLRQYGADRRLQAVEGALTTVAWRELAAAIAQELEPPWRRCTYEFCPIPERPVKSPRLIHHRCFRLALERALAARS